MVQRLWHAISAAAGHEPNGQPVSRIQNIENIKALLSGLESLLEVFEVRLVCTIGGVLWLIGCTG